MLTDSLQTIKGIGVKRAALLKKAGIVTIDDLLHYRPGNYIDIRIQKPLPKLKPGEYVAIKGWIEQKPKVSYLRKGFSVTRVYLTNHTGRVLCTWFNQPYIARQIMIGQTYFFTGNFSSNGQYIANPSYEVIPEDEILPPIIPVYKLLPGISQKTMRALVKSCLENEKDAIKDPIPKSFRLEENLSEYDFAIRNIHYPKNFADLELAQKRLAYEEVLLFEIALAVLKGNTGEKSERIFADQKQLAFRINKLPFELTHSQKEVLDEIIGDIAKDIPMNRLIQGDVGSGKTVVAFLVAYVAVQAGFQCAIMAPTETLAMQHYRNAVAFFKNCKVGLLTGRSKGKVRENALACLENGKWNVVVGTQALIQDDVAFNRLGLVVTDEQHRFGVAQRAILMNKGFRPHSLVMSATPIPRTLALVLYGDLKISVLTELPAGRKTVKTYIVPPEKTDNMYEFIKNHCKLGMQAYIICPLVNYSEESDLTSAEEMFALLKGDRLGGCSVGMLHGKMNPKDKEQVLHDFTDGKIDALVSTTVIEVGIDVPNANMMVILNAERFGLSQLHQMRGRIGRGEKQAYCFLQGNFISDESKKRMDIMVRSHDGFYIAQKDLEIRGPGQMLGTVQHGMGPFNMAVLIKDPALLERTGKIVKKLTDKNFASKDGQILLCYAKDKYAHIFDSIVLN